MELSQIKSPNSSLKVLCLSTSVLWTAKVQDFVILNHPFPTPENMEDDFRDEQGRTQKPQTWPMLQKESIYVVRSEALSDFLCERRLATFRSGN